MLIDSHCHLNRLKLDAYDGDLARAIRAAKEAGVEKMLCAGVDMEHIDEVVTLAGQYDEVYGAVGIHPLQDEPQVVDKGQLLNYARHPKIVAIGECGLDYYYSAGSKTLQQQRFIAQLQVASLAKLPVIVHTRDAREDTLALMRAHADREVGGVLHCFTESWEMAKAAMDMNYFISISGIVSFKAAADLREVVRKVPLDRLLIETDSPFLAPVPHRGQSNEPRFLVDVARCVAKVRGISLDELARATTNNFFALFSKAGS